MTHGEGHGGHCLRRVGWGAHKSWVGLVIISSLRTVGRQADDQYGRDSRVGWIRWEDLSQIAICWAESSKALTFFRVEGGKKNSNRGESSRWRIHYCAPSHARECVPWTTNRCPRRRFHSPPRRSRVRACENRRLAPIAAEPSHCRHDVTGRETGDDRPKGAQKNLIAVVPPGLRGTAACGSLQATHHRYTELVPGPTSAPSTLFDPGTIVPATPVPILPAWDEPILYQRWLRPLSASRKVKPFFFYRYLFVGKRKYIFKISMRKFVLGTFITTCSILSK